MTPPTYPAPIQTPSDTPEAALTRYLATVNTRLTCRKEIRRQIEDAKIQASQKRRPLWWMKD